MTPIRSHARIAESLTSAVDFPSVEEQGVSEPVQNEEGQTAGVVPSPITNGIFVMSLANKKAFKLGRGHDSDIRITDVSISRWHASISVKEDGKFVIEDNNSKFGTLIALRKPVAYSEGFLTNPPLLVQSGRTLFKMQVERSLSPELGAQ